MMRRPPARTLIEVAGECPKIIGTSVALFEVLERATRVAQTIVPVMIEGETGTGKELLARRIHAMSPRSAGPFVAVNCAAIPKDLFESELFGHERGAFTGAVAAKAGAFERAHGGTLFLDEIGDMAFEHQAKLLRAIQEREVQRVGGSAPRSVDVRIVAATHRALASGDTAFREDLYYRLAGYTLRLPPLRERGHDVVTIAKAILAREFPSKTLSRSAQQRLLTHSWPGNVRELENVLRAAAIDARGQRIDHTHLRQITFATAADEPRSRSELGAERLTAVRDHLSAHGRITATDVRRLFHLQKAHAQRLLARWEHDGTIVRHGQGRGTFYTSADRQGHDEPLGQPQLSRMTTIFTSVAA